MATVYLISTWQGSELYTYMHHQLPSPSRLEREALEQQLAEAEERTAREIENRVRREAEQEMRRQIEEKERAITEKMERLR